MKDLKKIASKGNIKTGDEIIDNYNLTHCMSNTTSFLDNIKGKKVLVLGSGPSAREIDWINKDWDVLVTVSHFYLAPEVLEQKPIHVTLSKIVNLGDKKLTDYLDNNPKCTIGFEAPTFSHSGKMVTLSNKSYSNHPINQFITLDSST